MLLVYLTPEESANPAILQQITDALRNAQGAELGVLTCGHHIHPDDNPSTGVSPDERVALYNPEIAPVSGVEPPLSSLFSVTAEAQAINPQAPVVPVPPAPSTAVVAPLPIAPVVPTPGQVPAPPAAVVPVPTPAAVVPVPTPAAVAPAPTAPAITPNPAGGAQTDASGLPWDVRIHSSPPKINDSDKLWRKKRGVDPQLVIQVEAQLRQVMGAPAAPAPIAPVASVVPPAPPVPSTPQVTTAGTAYPSDFGTFITLYTRAVAKGELDEASALEVVKTFGVPAIGLLVTRTDLIPAVSQALSLKV